MSAPSLVGVLRRTPANNWLRPTPRKQAVWRAAPAPTRHAGLTPVIESEAESELRGDWMSEAEMSAALDAVHEEALKLARRDDLPEGVQDGLNLIILLARHKADVRNQREK